MSRKAPQADCFDLAFQFGYPMGEPAEVALEDYARALTLAREAEALRRANDPSMVEGMHVCGLGSPLTQTMAADLEDFAKELATRGGGTGLGWS
jgi:hypothetical protein